jgi:transposase
MRTAELLLEIQELKKELKAKDEQIAELKNMVSLLQILHFGPKSERLTYEDERQGKLFNEAEEEVFKQVADDHIKSGIPTREVGAYIRRAINRDQGRKPISKDLPREVVTYDISEDEKICACGTPLCCIGEETTERVQIIPAKVTVLQEKRLKYACKKCEGTFADTPGVITAEGKKNLIPRSIATSSLLAWSLSEKFEYALPFYRQEKRLAHIGVPIPRATLAGLSIRAGMKCKPLYELLKKHIQTGILINADETSVQVLKEAGRKPQDKSWMQSEVYYTPLFRVCQVFKIKVANKSL